MIRTAYVDMEIPSVNHLYFTRGSIRRKTKEGRVFFNELNRKLCAQWGRLSELNPNLPVEVTVRVGLPNILCKTWNKKGGAGMRFTIIDVDNKEKVLLDALAHALRINDCCFFRVTFEKYLSAKHEVEITVHQNPELERLCVLPDGATDLSA